MMYIKPLTKFMKFMVRGSGLRAEPIWTYTENLINFRKFFNPVKFDKKKIFEILRGSYLRSACAHNSYLLYIYRMSLPHTHKHFSLIQCIYTLVQMLYMAHSLPIGQGVKVFLLERGGGYKY